MEPVEYFSNRKTLQSTLDEILVVIVIYKENLKDSVSFKTITECLKNHIWEHSVDIFVYDNSPKRMVEDNLECYQKWNVHYAHNPSNPGVSKAYNEGFKIAKELNKSWMLILDQDTYFPENALLKYCESVVYNHQAIIHAPVLMSLGNICSPCKYYFKRGFPLKSITPGYMEFKNRNLLNSGLLIKCDAFEKVGGYDEKVKLYFSDFNFVDKLRKIYTNFVVIDLICQHGNSSVEISDLENSVKRFGFYCEGAKNSSQEYLALVWLFLFAFIRGFKLSLNFKNFKFIVKFVEIWFRL